MADEPKSSPISDPKASGKAGAVKPPVLEGSARPTGEAKPEAEKQAPAQPGTTTGKSSASGTVPPRPAERRDEAEGNGASPWLAGLLGGIVGLGAAYGLAWAGLWPSPAPAPADPRIAPLSAAIPELQTVTGTLQDELATLTSRVGSVEAKAAQPAAAASPVDSELASRVEALAARVEALATAPASVPDDTAANAQAVATLETALGELRQQLGGADARIAAAESQLQSLASAASTESRTQQDAFRLPLILSSLESAFTAGRPYEAELTALRRTLPDSPVPETISARAAAGLPQADTVAQRLDDLVPDILAGRPAAADASWQDGALDWMRGVIAMRPTGQIEGDGPDAIVARLETAVGRRDFVAAEDALAALPESMRNAATPVAGDIAALAGAQTFLSGLRMTALSQESGT